MAPEGQTTHRMLALVDGSAADEPVVEMACLLARQKEARLYLVTTVVIGRALALDAPLPDATERARTVLDRALGITTQHGCTAQGRELRTRDTAAAVVDEAADLGCAMIFLGVSDERRGVGSALAVAEQVLLNAPCPVWLYRGRAARR